jgi:hypothetical protein
MECPLARFQITSATEALRRRPLEAMIAEAIAGRRRWAIARAGRGRVALPQDPACPAANPPTSVATSNNTKVGDG